MTCYKVLKKMTKDTSFQLVQNDQTKGVSYDENNFFPVIRKRIRCNIIKRDDEQTIDLRNRYSFDFL